MAGVMGCEVRDLPYKDISWEMLLESVLRLERAHTHTTHRDTHTHTHTCLNTYSTIQTGGRVGLGMRCFAPTFFPEAHASWWQFKTLHLRSLIFFFQRARLFWADIFFTCSLVGMNPVKMRTRPSLIVPEKVREGAFRCSALRCFPSGSHLPHQILLLTGWYQPPGGCSWHLKSISWAVNLPRLPQLRGAAFPDWAFWEKPEFHFYSSSLGPQWSWLILRINCLINEEIHTVYLLLARLSDTFERV